MGRWIDVDPEKEMENINSYRYFDEEQFEQNYRQMVMLELANAGEHPTNQLETDSQIEVEE